MLASKKPAETSAGLAQQNLVASYPKPFMVAVDFIADRRTLLHRERPLFPTSKRAKVELRSCLNTAHRSEVWIHYRGDEPITLCHWPDGRRGACS
jgi:hypothetical protein